MAVSDEARRDDVGQNGAGTLVVEVDDRRRLRTETLEQRPLGPPVVLDRPVVLEMLVGDVGNGADGEIDVVQPMQIEAVGGRLQRRDGAAGVYHPTEQPLVLDRLLRRLPQRVAILDAGDPDRHGAGHSRRHPCG